MTKRLSKSGNKVKWDIWLFLFVSSEAHLPVRHRHVVMPASAFPFPFNKSDGLRTNYPFSVWLINLRFCCSCGRFFLGFLSANERVNWQCKTVLNRINLGQCLGTFSELHCIVNSLSRTQHKLPNAQRNVVRWRRQGEYAVQKVHKCTSEAQVQVHTVWDSTKPCSDVLSRWMQSVASEECNPASFWCPFQQVFFSHNAGLSTHSGVAVCRRAFLWSRVLVAWSGAHRKKMRGSKVFFQLKGLTLQTQMHQNPWLSHVSWIAKEGQTRMEEESQIFLLQNLKKRKRTFWRKRQGHLHGFIVTAASP